jgi:hypothetical protein
VVTGAAARRRPEDARWPGTEFHARGCVKPR